MIHRNKTCNMHNKLVTTQRPKEIVKSQTLLRAKIYRTVVESHDN